MTSRVIESMHPDSVGSQEVVEGAMEAFKEYPDISSVRIVRQRGRHRV
jgi:hypothetical protein